MWLCSNITLFAKQTEGHFSLQVIVCQLLLCTFTQANIHPFFHPRLRLCRSTYHFSYIFQTGLNFVVALKKLSPVFYLRSEKDLLKYQTISFCLASFLPSVLPSFLTSFCSTSVSLSHTSANIFWNPHIC